MVYMVGVKDNKGLGVDEVEVNFRQVKVIQYIIDIFFSHG